MKIHKHTLRIQILSLTLALDGVGGCHDPAALTPRNNPVSIVKEAGWPPGPVWTDAENLAPTRFVLQLLDLYYIFHSYKLHI
jgi:hypothetical protein